MLELFYGRGIIAQQALELMAPATAIIISLLRLNGGHPA